MMNFRIPKKTWLIIALYISLASLIYIYKDWIIDWIKDGSTAHLPLVFVLMVLLALVPIMPFGVVGSLIGAKYGFLIGSILNVTSTTCAAILLFLAAQYTFRDRALKAIQASPKSSSILQWVEKRAFLTIFYCRLIPIVPAFAVNLAAGLCRMRWTTFAAATFLGKIPVMMLFAFIGDQWLAHPVRTVIIVLIYTLALIVTYMLMSRKITTS